MNKRFLHILNLFQDLIIGSRNKFGICAIIILTSGLAFAAVDAKKVRLQILDKINAEKHEIVAELDEKKIFQDLEIKLKRCRKSEAEEKQENLALLEIHDIARNTPREQYFYGWMFSSSPALSALEHPIYDVIVLECVE